MAWSEPTQRKANRLVFSAIDAVEDFQDDMAGPTMTESQKAEVGVILAVAAFAKLRKQVGLFRFYRIVIGSIFASKIMARDLLED